MGEILIVEPEQTARTLLVAITRTCGFQPYTAATAMDALELLPHIDRPRLFILAEKMPVMDGGDLLAALERDARWSEVPVIVCSQAPGSLFTSALTAMGTIVVARPPSRTVLVPHLLALHSESARPSAQAARERTQQSLTLLTQSRERCWRGDRLLKMAAPRQHASARAHARITFATAELHG